jgi:hypothetical protein
MVRATSAIVDRGVAVTTWAVITSLTFMVQLLCVSGAEEPRQAPDVPFGANGARIGGPGPGGKLDLLALFDFRLILNYWRSTLQRLAIVGVLAALSCGTMAHAECLAPSAPSLSERPVKPVSPERPRCANTGSCGVGEADRYNAAVAVFNDKAKVYAADLQAYVDRLNAYVAAAGAYAKCEVTATNAG